jgi:uncharacterized membrane protein YdjX (TVP38/TMEM64 family)
MNLKRGILLLTAICIAATIAAAYFLDGINLDRLQATVQQAGLFAPVLYIILYIIFTLFILPSTALNLMGGALFGLWLGTLWTSIAAIISAIAAFAFTRSIGRELVAQKLAGRWEQMDAEIRQSGLFYMFAIRLLPIIPYGLVNFTAGLTSIRFRDYLLGTMLGTIPGILPFVMMGSGLQALNSGDRVPLTIAFTLTGVLIMGATWYKQQRRSPKSALEAIERSNLQNRLRSSHSKSTDRIE